MTQTGQTGKVDELCGGDQGLFVRAIVTDSQAKQSGGFSIAATIHGFMPRNVDDPERFHALVTCATLDEVSLTNSPANAVAVVQRREKRKRQRGYHRLGHWRHPVIVGNKSAEL